MSLASSVLPSAASASAQLCVKRGTWQVVKKVKKKVKRLIKKLTGVRKRKEEKKDEEEGCRRIALMQGTVLTWGSAFWQVL